MTAPIPMSGRTDPRTGLPTDEAAHRGHDATEPTPERIAQLERIGTATGVARLGDRVLIPQAVRECETCADRWVREKRIWWESVVRSRGGDPERNPGPFG